MAEELGYSLGIDLGQTPSPTAIVRGDSVDAIPPHGGPPSQPPIANDEAALVQQTVDAVGRAAAREGSAPSTVVLALPGDQLAEKQGLAAEVARRLGLRPDQVSLVDGTALAVQGRARMLEGQPGSLGDPSTATAVGAALHGAASQGPSATGGVVAAGAAGALAGGLGAALLGGESTAAGAGAGAGAAGASTFGPPGVPLGSAAGVGPTGVPLGAAPVGPAGVPMGQTAGIGPTGVPVGSGTPIGPAGVSMSGAGAGPPGVPIKVARAVAARRRVVLIGGAVAAVAVVAVVAVVAASPSDSPASVATPAPTEATVPAAVVPSATEAATTVATDVAATTTTTTSVAATVAPSSLAPPCVVGTWIADNKGLVTAILGSAEAQGGIPIENGDATGEARLEIAADGTVVTTFDNWLFTGALPEGIGSMTIAESGSETHNLSFAADGSYSVTAQTSYARMTLTMAGTVLFDSPIASGVLASPGTYTCTGDQLVIDEPNAMLISAETFTRSG